MRFLFRKKDNERENDTVGTSESSYSGLGLFSPVIDTTESIQDDGWKRLSELEQIFVRSKKLLSLEDVTSIVNDVRDGNIVLLDIRSLNNGKEQCRLELKRIIERIRGETRGFRADLALVNDDCVIVTPPFVRMGS
jgi:SepF-like predicted cell division protein (DUF552 family)